MEDVVNRLFGTTEWGSPNIYYSREKIPWISPVAEIEDPSASYDFSTVLLVLCTENNKLYAAHDSGCSCPTPFEGFQSLADMAEVNSLADFQKVVSGSYADYKMEDIIRAEKLVLEHLQTSKSKDHQEG